MKPREVGVQKGVPQYQSYDIDTINTIILSDEELQNLGRKNIVINASVEDFYSNPAQVVADNLSYILGIHRKNVEEMRYLRNFHKGKQDILDKTRPNGDTKINNKAVTNYAWEFVNFKKGYYVGKPIKYVDINGEENNKDIKYFNRYNRDIKKPSKDLVKYENMLITGVAYTMTLPVKNKIDVEWQSPYTYTILDNEDVCIVRANDIYKTKLFSMCISNIVDNNKTYEVYEIYYGDNFIELTKDDTMVYVTDEGKMPVEDCITEYQLNEQRMGVFEPVLSLLNSMNKMTSVQLDQLEELVNTYLTFENVDAKSIIENIDEFRRKRLLVVNTNKPDTPAKIGSIKIDSEHSSVNEKYNTMEQRTYDIIGVPMPTSSTGQGVSGEAQVYGGGWENAQTIALVDTQYILQFEEEDLYKFIYISKDKAGTKTPNLVPTDIEVKYTINKSNNMMTKAQSMTYFVDKGFTREQALTFCEITDDPQSQGAIADENYRKTQDEALEFELLKTQKLKEINQVDNENEKVDKVATE